LGAAHGLSSVLQVVFSLPGFVQRTIFKNHVLQALDWLLRSVKLDGSYLHVILTRKRLLILSFILLSFISYILPVCKVHQAIFLVPWTS